uniref:RING-type domain-containing protein n=2 Tax=Acrobeloides nanus TaxID=290746 RepID=A0A914EP98_9BILA
MENIEESFSEWENPLECILCRTEMKKPTRLSCQHAFCRECIPGKICPLCRKPIETELTEDPILLYIIESSREVTEVCGNSHSEPYILFCLESKKMMCIECFNSSSLERRNNFVNIDIAHKLCFDKLEKNTLKLRGFQEELKEHIEVRKRLVAELDDNCKIAASDIEKKCEELVNQLVQIKDSFIQKINDEKKHRDEELRKQLKTMCLLQIPIKLNLLSASIFCSYASKMDFLHCFAELSKSIQTILSNEVEKVKFTGELCVDYREEFMKAVEKAFCWSSVLLQPATTMIKPIAEIKSSINRIVMKTKSRSGSVSPLTSSNGYRCRKCGPELCSSSILPNIQFMVDLNGAFGEQFKKVELPLKQFAKEISWVSKMLVDIQRDITLRRCVVDKDELKELITRCEQLEQKVCHHSTTIQSLQPIFREIWQETLDRVRRQQSIFKQKIDEIGYLQEFAQQARTTAQNLRPFAIYMASVISIVDGKRSQIIELAPMEQICLQITTITPDSRQRIEAIEKEEECRKMAKEKERIETEHEAQSVKKHLKIRKEPSLNKPRPSSAVLVENSRDRLSVELSFKSMRKREKSERSSIDDLFQTRSPSPMIESISSLSGDLGLSIASPCALSPIETRPASTSPVSASNSPRVRAMSSPEAQERSSETNARARMPEGGIPPPPPPPPIPIFDNDKSSVKKEKSGFFSTPTSSFEAVCVREKLLESIKERVKKIDPINDSITNSEN